MIKNEERPPEKLLQSTNPAVAFLTSLVANCNRQRLACKPSPLSITIYLHKEKRIPVEMEVPNRNGTKSFYEELGSREGNAPDIEDGQLRTLDETNLAQEFDDENADEINAAYSRITVGSPLIGHGTKGRPRGTRQKNNQNSWVAEDDDLDEDVPASLLVENNTLEPIHTIRSMAGPTGPVLTPPARATSPRRHRAQWEAVKRQQRLYADEGNANSQPYSVLSTTRLGGRRERALWRWVNTSSLDSFMRDVYDYYEGGGMWCILCSNALWLL